MTVWSSDAVLEKISQHANDGIGLSPEGTRGVVSEMRRLQEERKRLSDRLSSLVRDLTSMLVQESGADYGLMSDQDRRVVRDWNRAVRECVRVAERAST